MNGDHFSFHAGDHPGDFVLKKPRAKGRTLAELLPAYFEKLERGEPPIVWPIDTQPWGTFAFRPKQILLVGAPTGTAKTVLVVNSLVRALTLTPTLRVVLATVEEEADDLINRALASLRSIPVHQLRHRERAKMSDEDLAQGRGELEGIGPRLYVLDRPFTLDEVALAAADFKADVVAVDYLQELRVDGYDGDLQETIRRVMPMLRGIADTGPCVFVTSALSREGVIRTEELAGERKFKSSNLSAFLGGTQIEYAANDAFLLLNEGGKKSAAIHGEHDDDRVPMWLQHLKARGDRATLIPLWFEGEYQRLTLRSLSPDSSSAAAPGSTSRSHRTPKPTTPAPAKPAVIVAQQGLAKEEPEDEHWIAPNSP